MSTRAQIAIQTGPEEWAADKLDCFEPPRAPRILPLPTCELCHLYIWKDTGWVDITDMAE